MPGTKCAADLLTKVLLKEMNDFHRAQLGIIEILGQEEWQVITNKELKKQPKKSDVQVVDILRPGSVDCEVVQFAVAIGVK